MQAVWLPGDSDVGGLVGEIANRSVNNSYATGKVSGKSSTGGLIGNNVNGIVNTSYWDIETSKIAAGNNARGAGKTTSALQGSVDATGIYSNWES